MPRKRPGAVGGRRDQNRRDNVERLGAAALALFLEHGTQAVTIDQLADAAAMAKGSFYRYARDKAELVEQIMAPVVGEVTAAIDHCEQALRHARRETLASIYVRLATELALAVGRHPRQVQLYLQEARAPESPTRRTIHALADQLEARAIALTEIARTHGLIRDVDPEIAARLVIGAVDTMLFAHLRRRRAPPGRIPQVITELVAIVLRGVAPDGGRV